MKSILQGLFTIPAAAASVTMNMVLCIALMVLIIKLCYVGLYGSQYPQ